MEITELSKKLDEKIDFKVTLRMTIRCNCSTLLAYELNKYARDEVKISMDGSVTIFEFLVKNRLVVTSVLKFLEYKLKEFNIVDIYAYVDLRVHDNSNGSTSIIPVTELGLTLNSGGWDYINPVLVKN